MSICFLSFSLFFSLFLPFSNNIFFRLADPSTPAAPLFPAVRLVGKGLISQKELVGALQNNQRLCSFCRAPAVVAIATGHEVDIVLAGGGKEGGIHLLHFQPAMRVCRMTGGAGLPGGAGMGDVAIQATQAFMHPERCAVFRGTGLAKGVGGVALHAKPLPRVRGKSDGMIPLGHGGDGEQVGAERNPFVPDV